MIRATAFNLLFYLLNIGLCIACLPVIFMPREAAFDFIHFYVSCIYWLERHVLGLDFEVRGREHLPASGPYIVAAKHQSAYETFKLHLLWRDPAVVLKRELIRVPLWGRFLARSEPIAIDRRNARASMRQLMDGALRVRDQSRVLVVFPQGTRVDPGMSPAVKPYRVGVEQMQAATGMPVIPLALNSGKFWPRRGWMKRPGRAIFEFLPAIAPELTGKTMLKELENRLEAASDRLAGEAHIRPRRRKGLAAVALLVAALAGLYIAGWFYAAGLIRTQIDKVFGDLRAAGVTIEGQPPTIDGFPGPHRVTFSGRITDGHNLFTLPILTVRGIPLPGHRIAVNLPRGASFSGQGLDALDSVDRLGLRFVLPYPLPNGVDRADLDAWQRSGGRLTIESLDLDKQGLAAHGSGTVGLDDRLQPEGEGNFHVSGYATFLDWLTSMRLLSKKDAKLAGFIAAGLSQPDTSGTGTPYMRVALTLKDRQLYIGPLLVLTVPELLWPPEPAHPPAAPR